MAIVAPKWYGVLLQRRRSNAKETGKWRGKYPQAENGRWEGGYTVGHAPDTGKQIFKNVLGRTQGEVKEKLRKAQEAAKEIDFTKAGEYTAEEWLRLWYETYSKPNVRDTTAAGYRNFTENHIIPAIGKIKLEKLTSLDIQKM